MSTSTPQDDTQASPTTSTSTTTNIISIPHTLTYLLPTPFSSTIFNSFLASTTTPDPVITTLLTTARTKPFISYDPAFLTLLGPNPIPNLIEARSTNSFGEAGVWIPSLSEIWYTTWINDGPTHIEILSLTTLKTRIPTFSTPVQNPNGGYYHPAHNLIYFACLRDDSRSWPGGVVSINPLTYEVTPILNSYFGLKFDCIDDLCWVTCPTTTHEYMFITILPTPSPHNTSTSTKEDTLPQGLWRWDPQNSLLLPAISRTEYPVANGIRPGKDNKSIWLTDFGGEERSRVWGLPSQVGAPAVYRYDLDADMWPVNKRIFSVARMQAPDGIRIDDAGRVWTAEGEGVVVRSKQGKVLGVFNAHYFTRDPVNTAIVQFELAGDMLVILGMDKLWSIKLAEVVNKA